MTEPRVSVILNSFNQARFVRAAVDSVLEQGFDDFELLIVDNGSSDESPQILAPIASDPRVRMYLGEENLPVTVRFNQAIRTARGSFVSFLYSDDFYLPEKLEHQVGRFDRLGPQYGVVYSRALGLNDITGETWRYGSIGASGDVFQALMLRHRLGQIDMCNPLVRRECLLKHPFHEDIFAEGEAIFLRLALHTHFAFLDEPVVVLRDHGRNAGKAIKWNCDMTLQALRLLRAEATADQRQMIDHFEGHLLRSYGWQTIRTGNDVQLARAFFRAAARISVRHGLHPKVAVGWALSVLPAAVRERGNRLGDTVRPSHGNRVWVDPSDGS